MAAGQIPQPEWFDMGDELDRIATEAGLVREDENWSWPSDPSTSWNPFVPSAFDDFYPPEPSSDPLFAPQTVDGPQMLLPGTSLGPSEFDAPLAPMLGPTPLPPTDPWYDDGGCFSGGFENFPGWGNSPQPALEGTNDSTQEAEASTSLAPAKPQNIENNNRQEQPSGPAQSSSGGGNKRAQNREAEKLCIRQICDALVIPQAKSELVTLRKIIEHMGGTVPDPLPAPEAWLMKSQREVRKREECGRCLEELRRLSACPSASKLKLLEKVLAKVTASVDDSQAADGENQQYNVFRAW